MSTSFSPKIKDPAHAVRVLEALVEQGDRIEELTAQLSIKDCSPGLWRMRAGMFSALVEGAKAVLGEWERIGELYADDLLVKDGYMLNGQALLLVVLAQAYAPRMAEAGMEVPS